MEHIVKPDPNSKPEGNPLHYGLSSLLALVMAVAVAVVMRGQGLWAASNYAAVVGVCMSMPWALYWYRREGRSIDVFLASINQAAIASTVLGTAAAWLTNLIL